MRLLRAVAADEPCSVSFIHTFSTYSPVHWWLASSRFASDDKGRLWIPITFHLFNIPTIHMTSVPPLHKMGIMLKEAAGRPVAEQNCSVCVCVVTFYWVLWCMWNKVWKRQEYEASCISVSVCAAHSCFLIPSAHLSCNILIGAGSNFRCCCLNMCSMCLAGLCVSVSF